MNDRAAAEPPRVYPNVHIGGEARIGDFVTLGEPPRGHRPGELETRIGDGAIVRSYTVIYAGNVIGDRFQTGHHVLVRELNQVGNDVSIGSSTIIEHHVVIEDGVRIHSQAFVPEHCVLKAGCWLGPNVVLTNAKYPNHPKTKDKLEGVVIGVGAVIGANATLLPGIEVGDGAVVGAGSVVTKSIPAGALAFGNPAVVRGSAADATY